MSKMTKVKEFVKNHKTEIGCVTSGVIAGAVCMVIGYKHGAKTPKDYIELTKLVQEFDDSKADRTLWDSIKLFLGASTHGVYPVIAIEDKTLGDMLSDEIIDILGDYGLDSNTKAAGVMVGVKK
jgi:hypothetical protein